MKLISSVKIMGDNFLADKFEKEIGIEFSSKLNKGQICNYGRFKDKPFPHGFAIVKATDIDSNVNLEFGTFNLILDFALENRTKMIELGAESISIDVAIYHSGMVGWELTREELFKLNQLGSDLSITYYDEELPY